MAAAKFKGVLTVKNKAGQIKSFPLTVSDVNGEFWLHPSGSNEMPLSSQDCWIVDVNTSGGGTDTSQNEVYLNGVFTGYIIYNALNIPTVVQRQVAQAPIFLPAGSMLKIKQLT